MKRIAAVLSALALGAVPALVPVSPAHAHAAPCATRWGSLPEDRNPGSTGEVVDVRAGRHACFDRLVLDVSGKARGYVVRYVDQVQRDGSGTVVPVRGGARLSVTVTAPPRRTDAWWDEDGRLLDTSSFRTFRDLQYAGGFEGQTTFGLGVRARLPFRVLLLDGPGTGSRVVVDVAHRW